VSETDGIGSADGFLDRLSNGMDAPTWHNRGCAQVEVSSNHLGK